MNIYFFKLVSIVTIEILYNKCNCKGKGISYRNRKTVWKRIEDVSYGTKSAPYKSVSGMKNAPCRVRNVSYRANRIAFEKRARPVNSSAFQCLYISMIFYMYLLSSVFMYSSIFYQSLYLAIV